MSDPDTKALNRIDQIINSGQDPLTKANWLRNLMYDYTKTSHWYWNKHEDAAQKIGAITDSVQFAGRNIEVLFRIMKQIAIIEKDPGSVLYIPKIKSVLVNNPIIILGEKKEFLATYWLKLQERSVEDLRKEFYEIMLAQKEVQKRLQESTFFGIFESLSLSDRNHTISNAQHRNKYLKDLIFVIRSKLPLFKNWKGGALPKVKDKNGKLRPVTQYDIVGNSGTFNNFIKFVGAGMVVGIIILKKF